jgi:phospholipid/cholesterol/gamma-HCH transport system substrate-binding protein
MSEEQAKEMRSVTGVGRVAALGALIAAVVLVALLLFDEGGGYSVKARFISAGQLVEGGQVQTGGVSIGSVTGIEITDDGQAEITLEIDDDHAPLRRGTQATIRQFSLSGIANRYVDLTMPPNGTEEIEEGGALGTDSTPTAVDIDSCSTRSTGRRASRSRASSRVRRASSRGAGSRGTRASST